MSRPKLAAAALVGLLVVVWAVRSFVLGEGSSDRPVADAPPSVVIVETLPGEGEPVPADRVVAAGELSGIPVGYPRTDQGATTAAVNWVASFPRLMRMGPLRLSNTLGELMTESAGPAGVAEAVADYWVLFDELGPEFRERVWIESPLQTNATSSSESVAEVRVWSVVTTGDPESGPIESIWRTHLITLMWERDDWRVDNVTVVEGPTPVPAEALLPSPPSDFDDVDSWTPAVFADTTRGEG
jgi:hypothetical protein